MALKTLKRSSIYGSPDAGRGHAVTSASSRESVTGALLIDAGRGHAVAPVSSQEIQNDTVYCFFLHIHRYTLL